MVINLKRTSNNNGFTLVELLVAAAIGLILLGIISQVFVSSTRAYSRNESMSRIQENGRFAMAVLRDSVAGAGFLGCAQDVTQFDSIVALPAQNFFINDYAQFIYGLEWVPDDPLDPNVFDVGTWQDRDPTGGALRIFNQASPQLIGNALIGTGMGLPNDILPGSDILTIRTVQAGQEAVLQADSGAVLTVPAGINSIDIATNIGADEMNRRPLLIADCLGSTLFYGNSYLGTTIDLASARNQAAALGRVYEQGSQVYATENTTYYLRNNANLVPSLFRTVGSGNPEELVEGVETIQVLYGIDTDADRNADVYVAANNALMDWGNIVSVRIGLLLRSPNQLIQGNQNVITYNVNGTNITAPGDRRIRMVMNITAGLRNRLR